MLIILALLPVLVLGQFFETAQQALQSRGYSQDQIDGLRERFTQLSAGLSPEAKVAERQIMDIVGDSSTPPFMKRVQVMQFMQSQTPSVRAELQSVKQQLMSSGGFSG